MWACLFWNGCAIGCPYLQKSLQKISPRDMSFQSIKKCISQSFRVFLLHLPLESPNSKIQRKFPKIQRENVDFGIFANFYLKYFKLYGCIPEVPTLLLIPILPYDPMSYVLPICVKICHIWHLWHIMTHNDKTFDINSYVNLGVKRSVRT